MIFLQTERLLLRNVTVQDTDTMVDYRNHPLCSKYQRGQVKTPDAITAFIEQHQNYCISENTPFFVAIAKKETNEMIGEILTMPSDSTFSFGYTVSYRHHRKGYAYEALSAWMSFLHTKYPVAEFISFTEPENIPSRNLLLKLGHEEFGYLPSKDSVVFGKYLTEKSKTELHNATKKELPR